MPACSKRYGPRFSAWQLEHDFVDRVARLQQPDVGRAVRVVARRAFHLALAHRHVAGAIQLGHLVAVAGHALLLLIDRLQLRLGRLRLVDAVTADARDVARFVLAALPQRMRSPVVARRAAVGHLPGRQPIELHRLDLLGIAGVRLARPVTGFASLGRRRGFADSAPGRAWWPDRRVVTGVAGGTGLGADVTGWRRAGCLRRRRRRRFRGLRVAGRRRCLDDDGPGQRRGQRPRKQQHRQNTEKRNGSRASHDSSRSPV